MWGRKRSASKYGNRRVNGFGSKLESSVCAFLEKKYGAENIQCQAKVYLTDARILYIADFKVTLPDGSEMWVEAKGVELSSWKLKKKLWKFYGPGLLQIYKGHYSRPFLAEELVPKRAECLCSACGAPTKALK